MLIWIGSKKWNPTNTCIILRCSSLVLHRCLYQRLVQHRCLVCCRALFWLWAPNIWLEVMIRFHSSPAHPENSSSIIPCSVWKFKHCTSAQLCATPEFAVILVVGLALSLTLTLNTRDLTSHNMLTPTNIGCLLHQQLLPSDQVLLCHTVVLKAYPSPSPPLSLAEMCLSFHASNVQRSKSVKPLKPLLAFLGVRRRGLWSAI